MTKEEFIGLIKKYKGQMYRFAFSIVKNETDAEDVVAEYFSKHENEAECKPDVIVVDPPRKGCDEKLLSTIVKMNPKRVVYVSCDSATLARDVKWLSKNGYKLKEATPCDMFGQTVHVETVALLSR